MNKPQAREILLASALHYGLKLVPTAPQTDLGGHIVSHLTMESIVHLIRYSQPFQYTKIPNGFRLNLLTSYNFLHIDFIHLGNYHYSYQCLHTTIAPAECERTFTPHDGVLFIYDFTQRASSVLLADTSCALTEEEYPSFCAQETQLSRENLQLLIDDLSEDGIDYIFATRQLAAEKYHMSLVSKSLTIVQLIQYLLLRRQGNLYDSYLSNSLVRLGLALLIEDPSTAEELFMSIAE